MDEATLRSHVARALTYAANHGADPADAVTATLWPAIEEMQTRAARTRQMLASVMLSAQRVAAEAERGLEVTHAEHRA